MNEAELVTLITIIVFCMAGSLLGAYFLGYSRGAKWEPEYEDPTPEAFMDPRIEILEDIEVIEQTGYLDAVTGPVTITTDTRSLGVLPSPDLEAEVTRRVIDDLYEALDKMRSEVARQNRLRKRYLRLLREERAMMLSYFTPSHEVKFSPYWQRWVKQRMQIVDEIFVAASWSDSEIANTR